jgi:hypothetical protein
MYPSQRLRPPSKALRIVDPNARPEQPAAAEDARKEKPQQMSTQFDVYARPYVPEVFTIINQLPAPIQTTPATKQIDFETYMHGFVGSDVFLPIPNRAELKGWGFLPDHITNIDYELYFRHHLQAEIESQQ